jgi:hypothetical protein
MCNEVEVPTSRVAAAVASVERLDFDPEYSILFSDILLAAQRKKWDRAALLPISSRLLSRHGKDLSWGEPEFRRAGSHLNDCPALALAGLREALSISHRQKAKAWTLKVATDLATILADQGDDDDAKATLVAALDDLPATTGGRDLAAARVLATRLGLERYLSR